MFQNVDRSDPARSRSISFSISAIPKLELAEVVEGAGVP